MSYQLDKTEVQPQEGWSEQDPLEIIHHIRICAENAIDQLLEHGKCSLIFFITQGAQKCYMRLLFCYKGENLIGVGLEPCVPIFLW